MSSTFRVFFVAIIALLLQGQVSGNYVRFWEEKKFKAGCVVCPIATYQRCINLDMKTIGRASSFKFFNLDVSPSYTFSSTLYDDKDCKGNYFRWSGTLNLNQGITYPNLDPYDNKIKSFKIADFLTSDAAGYQAVGDTKVDSTCYLGGSTCDW
ncbi:hypothetical protein BGZ54_010394 [Gamsiella multidivaricata]|nr:hypothetical protein BGZ54_010394 [Gamsiella multidivaricata]